MFNLFEIILLAILNLSMIISVTSLLYMMTIKKVMDRQSRILHVIFHDSKIYNDMLFDNTHNTETILENIETLSKSFNKYIIESTIKNKMGVMPTPEIANDIKETIKEQISTELTMIKDLRIIDNSIIHRIIRNVVRTYPDIDREYITRKILAALNLLDAK